MIPSPETQREFDSLMGKIIAGRFRVLKPVGEGSMGVVVLAEHTELANPVAIKVLREEFVPDENVLKRFRREARAASRISHRNIVYISDFGQLDDGRLFIVMEYIEGRTLREELGDRGALTLSRTLRILIQIAEALEAAHGQGVIHRDLKPENVILMQQRGRTDIVKMLDFGLAKIVRSEDGEQSVITKTGQIFGTPAYMSPEQCSAEPVGAAADIYALGVLAWEMVVGRPPFTGHMLEVMSAHRTEPVPIPSEARTDRWIPPEYDQFVLRALQKQVTDRYESANDAQGDLLELREQLIKRATGRAAAGEGGFAKSGDAARSATKAPKRAEGAAIQPAAQAEEIGRPRAWTKQVARVAPGEREEGQIERRRYLTQLKRVAELIVQMQQGTAALAHLVEDIHHTETWLYDMEIDAAVFESWAERVEQSYGENLANLRNAVIELAQSRNEMCEELQLAPEQLRPTPLRGAPQHTDPRGRLWEQAMDVAYQIRELEWRMAGIAREQQLRVEEIDGVLADIKAHRESGNVALDRAKAALQGHVDALRPGLEHHTGLARQFAILDQLAEQA